MPKHVIAYHKTDGPVEMYTINAREAVTNHPDEWSFQPWTKRQASDEVERLPKEDVEHSENLPVNRAVKVTTEKDGTKTVEIAPGNEEGPPPMARPGADRTERKRS